MAIFFYTNMRPSVICIKKINNTSEQLAIFKEWAELKKIAHFIETSEKSFCVTTTKWPFEKTRIKQITLSIFHPHVDYGKPTTFLSNIWIIIVWQDMLVRLHNRFHKNWIIEKSRWPCLDNYNLRKKPRLIMERQQERKEKSRYWARVCRP